MPNNIDTKKNQKISKAEKTAVLLINLGTPDQPEPKHVKRYLKEFLFDPYVIQIPTIPRWILVNLIIAPFRSKQSAHAYQQIWSDKTGSPLKHNTNMLTKKMQQLSSNNKNIIIEFAKRYQNPSITSVLEKMLTQDVSKLIIIPLFPQYSQAATQSAIDHALLCLNKILKSRAKNTSF